METLTLCTPDDWHVHLRDGAALATTVPHSAAQFRRVLVMPNLRPPVTRVADALAYRQRLMQHTPPDSDFDPLMALYLTETTAIDEIRKAADEPRVLGFKLYPAGATTHSEAGVASLQRIYPLLDAMQRHDVPLMIHGEVTHAETDIFDRERVFIDAELEPMVRRFPALRIVLEHITTQDAVAFVGESPSTVAATITAHHLLYSRNALLAGGIRPHYYCLPILKRETHRQALLGAVRSGNPKFFLGTDSAPHARDQKESTCGCAGCYTAHAALELYATAFEQAGALERLDHFASHNGAMFYGLPLNEGKVTLRRTPWMVPETYELGNSSLVPLKAGESIPWEMLRQPGRST
jgi:dihydroorotase